MAMYQSHFFQVNVLFSIKGMQNVGPLWPIWLFCREFTHFLVYFYRAKYCDGVPKFTNMRYGWEIELSQWSGEAQGWILRIIFFFSSSNAYSKKLFLPNAPCTKKDSSVFLSSSTYPHVSHLIGKAKFVPEKWRIQILLFHIQYGSFTSSDEKKNRSHDSTCACLHPKSHMSEKDIYILRFDGMLK